MPDEPSVRGWLPPRAPGAQAPPRFEPAPEEPPAPEPPAASGWQPPVAQQADPYWGSPPPPPPSPPAAETATGPTFVRPERARASGLAVTAIVLGVIGIALLVLSVGTSFLLSLPCSAAAWACGMRARQRAEADPTSSSRGPAQTGVVLGMVGVALGIVSAVVWIILFSVGITIEDLRDYLERQLQEERR